MKRAVRVLTKKLPVGTNSYVLVSVAQRPPEIPERVWQELGALNDFIIDRVNYDQTKAAGRRRAGEDNRHQAPQETLRLGRGVCQDYAALFEDLATQQGHRVRSVHSTQLNHAWNEVWIAGCWWLIDVTWNDAAIFRDGGAVPQSVRSDPDHRKRYFLTTVEREEALQRAGLLQQTHRARDLEPVDYARTRAAYPILDAINPAITRYNTLVAQQRAATERCNVAVHRFNGLVRQHNSQRTAAAQARFAQPLEQARQEVAALRAEAEVLSRQCEQLAAQIADLRGRFRALAQSHPLAVRLS